MYIKGLRLVNYRNYEELDIEFSRNFNIIHGNNGQGKTNILEAIFLCSSGRSHRTSKDGELIRMDQSAAKVLLTMDKDGMDSSVEIDLKKDEKKRIRINEIPLKKLGALMGHLTTVIFSPEDLMIIKEGPSERRRFIDITISQLKPSYFYDLQQYYKILHQRNSLLREIQQKRDLLETLEIWNNSMAETGARIMKVRGEFLKKLSQKASAKHLSISDGKEKLHLEYSPSVAVPEDLAENLHEIKMAFLKKMERAAAREQALGTTLYGPQRDDYEIFINDASLKQYGSQGQQRTAVLSIKLSEIDIMKEETGDFPVLLLDDVMSELDSSRQEFLLKSLDHIQTFITSTDKSFYNRGDIGNTEFYTVSAGVVHREN